MATATEKLSIQQIEAAAQVAKGSQDKDVYESFDISRTTFHRWKTDPIFQRCVSLFQIVEREKLALVAELQTTSGDVAGAQNDEATFRDATMPVLTSLSGVVQGLAEDLKAPDAVISSPRNISTLINAMTTLIECIREGNDRRTGLEAVLNELLKAEKNL